MKKSVFIGLRYLALLLIFSMLATPKAQATHILGADIFYDHLGGNEYRISTLLYRDCNGINLGGSICLNLKSVGCGTSTDSTLTLNQVGTAVDITPLCAGAISRCSSPAGVRGVQRWLYQTTITLPSTCSDWVFRYNLTARNAAITTINSPSNQTLYIEARMYNVNAINSNNSPRFLNFPSSYGCNNQANYYSHGAYESDGDSIVFALMPCQRGVTAVGGTSNSTSCNAPANNNVDYVAGRSGSSPFFGTSSINPATGFIAYTPSQLQTAVVCVEVREYRSGQLIGSVWRDMEFTVVACSNNAPTISSPSMNAATCVGQPICLQFAGSDLDTANHLNMYWNNSIAGATFSSSSGANAITGQLCWTPTQNDTGTHHFTVSIADDNCPLTASNTYSYSIYVAPSNSRFQYFSAYFCQSTVTVTPLINGNMNGIFSALPVGLDIDSLTGGVDLMNSNIGTYSVRYVTTNSYCNDTTTAVFQIDNCSGISNTILSQNSYQIAPNPNSGYFSLQNKGEAQTVNIELIDVLGRRLYSQNNALLPANGALSLEIQQLPAATYFLRVSGENTAPKVLSVRIVQP